MTFYVGNFLRDRLLLENTREVNFFSIRDLERGSFSKVYQNSGLKGEKHGWMTSVKYRTSLCPLLGSRVSEMNVFHSVGTIPGSEGD